MEQFDTDTSLIGFENGVYDLKNNIFREGRPAHNVTLSTKVSIPVTKEELPSVSNFIQFAINSFLSCHVIGLTTTSNSSSFTLTV